MPSEFEEIIEQIGAFGPYQVRVFILVSMFETPLAWAMLLPALTSAKPPWICHDDNDLYVNSTDSIYNEELNATNFSLNFTSTCAANGKACQNIQFSSEFTSIVSEVSINTIPSQKCLYFCLSFYWSHCEIFQGRCLYTLFEEKISTIVNRL